jgi:hypothetical protein
MTVEWLLSALVFSSSIIIGESKISHRRHKF